MDEAKSLDEPSSDAQWNNRNESGSSDGGSLTFPRGSAGEGRVDSEVDVADTVGTMPYVWDPYVSGRTNDTFSIVDVPIGVMCGGNFYIPKADRRRIN